MRWRRSAGTTAQGCAPRGGCVSACFAAPALTHAARRCCAQIGGTQRYPWQEKLWEKSFEAAMKRLPLAVGVPGDTSDSGGDSSDSDIDDEAAPKDGDVAQARALRAGAPAARRTHGAAGGGRRLTRLPGATQAAVRRGRAAGASSSSSSDGDADEVLRHGVEVGRDGIFVSGAHCSRARVALRR